MRFCRLLFKGGCPFLPPPPPPQRLLAQCPQQSVEELSAARDAARGCGDDDLYYSLKKQVTNDHANCLQGTACTEALPSDLRGCSAARPPRS